MTTPVTVMRLTAVSMLIVVVSIVIRILGGIFEVTVLNVSGAVLAVGVGVVALYYGWIRRS
jgi:NADH:ubiquinone oxidoreductase subunit K